MFRSRPARKVRAYRPRLEFLEDRTLLSTYLVDRLTDTGAGSGLAGDLRYAITHAVDGDAINFGVNGIINLTGVLPDLTHNISINGPGANLLTVSGPGVETSYVGRVFTVQDGATVSISGLTITNGYTVVGGGIANFGTLTLSNSTVTGNTVTECAVPAGYGCGFDARPSYGGGILNEAVLTINNCTISDNEGHDAGGGVCNVGLTAILTINNSTIVDNLAVYGGGIANGSASDGGSGGTVTISNSTIAGNRAASGGGGIWNQSTLTARNSIIAGNTAVHGAPDLRGALTSSGYNLIGNSSGGRGFVATDLLNVDPLLGPLQDNGGPTQTMALLAGSPALNAGDPDQLGVADQRGVVRSGGVNIGAYQASASAFVLTAPATTTAGTPFNLTVKAVDTFGQTALGYTGTAAFSTTDTNPAVVLPANYTFTTADAGLHTFTGGATLASAGSQTLTATDTMISSLTGSAAIAVTPAAADHFVISVPASVTAGTAFDVTVTVVDAYGNTVPTYLGTVHFTTTDPDPRVILPADYVFMAADRGQHTFSGGATLDTTGDEIIRVTDTLDSTLTGSATVTL